MLEPEHRLDIKGEKGFFGNPDWDPATSMTLVTCFCHMSSVRSTSDGRGPVTRNRVPDRDEQGKPREDARRGRCHPLEAGIYPCGCHRYRDTQLPSTKYQVPGLHFVPWHRGSGCLGAAAPVTGAAADEYNLNVVDCM